MIKLSSLILVVMTLSSLGQAVEYMQLRTADEVNRDNGVNVDPQPSVYNVRTVKDPNQFNVDVWNMQSPINQPGPSDAKQCIQTPDTDEFGNVVMKMICQ